MVVVDRVAAAGRVGTAKPAIAIAVEQRPALRQIAGEGDAQRVSIHELHGSADHACRGAEHLPADAGCRIRVERRESARLIVLHVEEKLVAADELGADHLRPLIGDVAAGLRNRRAGLRMGGKGFRDGTPGAGDHQCGIARVDVLAAVVVGRRVEVGVVIVGVDVEDASGDVCVEARVGGQDLHALADRLVALVAALVVRHRGDEEVGRRRRILSECRAHLVGVEADRRDPGLRREIGRTAVEFGMKPQCRRRIVALARRKRSDLVQQRLLKAADRPVAGRPVEPVAQQRRAAEGGAALPIPRIVDDADGVVRAVEAQQARNFLRKIRHPRAAIVLHHPHDVRLATHQDVEIHRGPILLAAAPCFGGIGSPWHVAQAACAAAHNRVAELHREWLLAA